MSFYSFCANETTVRFTFAFLDLLSFFGLLLLLVSAYFGYYSNSTTSENLIDHDYLVGSTTVESEEEIGSIDDTFLGLLFLTLLFFWFFWMNGIIQWYFQSNFHMIFTVLPFLWILIFLMPTLLLFDYGLYFLTYLSGSGKSTSVTIEFTFDYIAMSIFYLRLLVQNVRLIFMVFTFTEFHEMLLLNHIVVEYSWFDDCIVANKGNYWNILKNGHYYLFMLCGSICHALYELLHTFFMVIFQFIAFFAMIFWLFLFLYSMFAVEMHEAHFYLKRKFLEKKRKIKIFFYIS